LDLQNDTNTKKIPVAFGHFDLANQKRTTTDNNDGSSLKSTSINLKEPKQDLSQSSLTSNIRLQVTTSRKKKRESFNKQNPKSNNDSSLAFRVDGVTSTLRDDDQFVDDNITGGPICDTKWQ
jgi:hypothetical protein